MTRIETLRRDPYAIYAEFILKLLPLPGLDQEPGAREIGTALHAALEQFCKRHPGGSLPENARDQLVELAQEKLGAFRRTRNFWRSAGHACCRVSMSFSPSRWSGVR